MNQKFFLIFFIIMLILILCYLIIKKRNISNFTDYKLDYNDLLKIFKIDFIKNNNVDVVCSGPSSKNLVLKSNIVIAVNDSILNKVVNSENNNRKVIWLACKKYHTYNNFKQTFLDKIKVNVDVIIIRWAIFKDKSENNKIIKMFKTKFPKVEIINNSIDFYKEIPELKKQRMLISCGIQAIHLALKNDANKIYVTGIEIGYEDKYSYNDEINVKPNETKAVHLNDDKKYLKQLDNKSLNKIIAINNSGLFKYLNN